MIEALETIPRQMWKRLNKLDLGELDVPKWSITVNETGVQVIEFYKNFNLELPSKSKEMLTPWVSCTRNRCDLLKKLLAVFRPFCGLPSTLKRY